VGRWENDTLIVETTGSNDRVWLDGVGHPRSEAMRMTERYRLGDVGHLGVEIAFDDYRMYNKPFTVRLPIRFRRTRTSWNMSATKTRRIARTWLIPRLE
jgi:hypothetical protein